MYYMMSKRSPVIKKCEQILLIIIFPAALSILMFHEGILTYNLSGLLAEENTRLITVLVLLLGGTALFPVCHTVFAYFQESQVPVIAEECLCLGELCIPYHDGTAVGQIHLLIGLALFLNAEIIFFRMRILNPAGYRWYLLAVITAFAAAVTFMSINGLSEWILAAATSFYAAAVNREV